MSKLIKFSRRDVLFGAAAIGTATLGTASIACAEIQFSEPSYGIGQAMLVKKGNPKAIKDYSSIAGNPDLKLAVMAGAVEVGYAKDSGVPQDQLVILPDQSSLLAAVQSGRADAASLTALSIAEMAKKGEGVESTKPFGE